MYTHTDYSIVIGKCHGGIYTYSDYAIVIGLWDCGIYIPTVTVYSDWGMSWWDIYLQ